MSAPILLLSIGDDSYTLAELSRQLKRCGVEGNWVAVSRKLLESDFHGDGYLKAVWIELLLMASWKERKVKFKGKLVALEPGQMLVSLSELVEALGFDRSTMFRKLKYLSETGRIETQTSNKNTMITICKWSEYQKNLSEHETQTKHGSQRQRNTGANARETPEGCSKIEEQSNKETKQPRNQDGCAEIKQLASEWCGHYRSQFTWTPPYDAQDDLFEAAIGKIEDECGLTTADVRKVFEFISSDPFWKTQNLDPSGLLACPLGKRERKIDSVMLKLKAKPFDAKEALRESIGKSQKPVDDIPF